MLLIYTSEQNKRFNYVTEVCFEHIFKLEYKITDNLSEFENSDCPCFWYAKEKVSEKPGIIANELILDVNLIISSPDCLYINNINVLFPTKSHLLPNFDLFASVFWYVTRMEEYRHYPKDVDNRFLSSMSFAKKIDSLQKPMANIWVKMFLEELKLVYPNLKYDKPEFKYIPSVDVDSAFMFKHKGFIRNIGGLLKDLFKNDIQSLKKRINVVLGKEKDPWFCFDFINELHAKYSLKPYYFFLLGKRSCYDKNISPRKRVMRNLINNLVKDGYTVGLHPSYNGNKNFKLWIKEIKRINNIINGTVFLSRQHYLFIKFPQTYNYLIDLGIKYDFSMIYPDMPGFRLGTTVSVPFFDLTKNERTELWLYPTMIMDVSLSKYQKLTPDDAIKQCKDLIKYTKEFGGTFISLWHNESLSEYGNWKGWNRVYEEVLKSTL